MDQMLNWSDCLTHVEMTDVGMRRANNQDSLAVLMASDVEAWRRRGHVFVVADGMGAHAAGELASKMAAPISTKIMPGTILSFFILILIS